MGIEQDNRTKLPMFCSEFAYYMLALSTCSPTDIKRAGAEGASCVQLPFSPMPLTAEKASDVGMADGPLINLLALPQSQRMESINKVFCSNGYNCVNGAKLSSGHRTVAATVAPLMAGLEKIYQALSTCSPTDIKRAGAEGASCVQLPFSPMPLTAEKASDVGMADGPLINLLALPQS